MFRNRLDLQRVVPVAAIAAVLAVAVAVTPSIAGSFLNTKKAAGIYLSKKRAHDLYVTKEKADHRYVQTAGSHSKFLTPSAAEKTYVAKTDLPPQPLGFINSSSVDFGPVQSTTAVPVPASAITFDVPVTSLVTLTFSGQSTCVAAAAGVGCPIQLLIDEQPTGEVKSNIALSSVAPGPAPVANTLVTTTVLTEGTHTASVQYAGSSNATLNFGLKDWSYSVVAYPSLD